MKKKRSILPLRVDGQRIDQTAEIICDHGLVARLTTQAFCKDRQMEHAEFIARACNIHDELLEALAEQIAECRDPNCPMCARHTLIIAKARGEPS